MTTLSVGGQHDLVMDLARRHGWVSVGRVLGGSGTMKVTHEAVEAAFGVAFPVSNVSRGTLRLALEAAAPHMSGVKVKPLGWRVPTDHPMEMEESAILIADGLGGKYAISHPQEVGPRFLLWWAHDAFQWAGFDTPDEAKAAAQADYERRILSALSSPAPEAAKGKVGIIGHVDHGKTSLAAAVALLSKHPALAAAEELEVVAYIQADAADELRKYKGATTTVSSGLLRKPFGDPTPLVRQSDALSIIEKLRAENERQKTAGYCDAQYLSDGPPFKCGWQHRSEAAEARLAEAVELLVRLGTWIEDEANAELPFITEAEDDAYRTFLQSLGKEVGHG